MHSKHPVVIYAGNGIPVIYDFSEYYCNTFRKTVDTHESINSSKLMSGDNASFVERGFI